MSRPSWLQRLYWAKFAKPVSDRALFQLLIDRPVSSVLEVGVGDGQRMRRIAQLARVPASTEKLRYVGTDEFESAQDGKRHLSLKQAHQIAGQLNLKASLIPGDIQSAIPRVAHKLGTSDLLIFNHGLNTQDPSSCFAGSWLNHLTHADSVILASDEDGTLVNFNPPSSDSFRRAA